MSVSMFFLSMVMAFAGEQETGPRYLIIHADDAGMCHSANRATIEAMQQGVVSSASIMVPCPWFPEIAKYAKENPGMDFGVHLTLTSEWKHYRWGPLTGRERVPSLVDEQGFLWAKVDDVARHVKVDEAELELRAQIDRALTFGVPVTHLDTHMGALACRPDLIELYIKLGFEYELPVLLPRTMQETLAQRFPHLAEKVPDILAEFEQRGLPLIDQLPSIPVGSSFEESKAIYLLALKHLPPGTTQIIIHCGTDDPELRAITGRYAHRDFDRRVFTDPDVKAELERLDIRVISWKELGELTRN